MTQHQTTSGAIAALCAFLSLECVGYTQADGTHTLIIQKDGQSIELVLSTAGVMAKESK